MVERIEVRNTEKESPRSTKRIRKGKANHHEGTKDTKVVCLFGDSYHSLSSAE